MACRIGITTNEAERKKDWEAQHPRLRNWTILSRHGSKTAAQREETAQAKRRGCVSQAGGAGSEYASWSVYYFEF